MRKIIGMMMIMMMMSCGQQRDTAGGKSLSEVLLEVGRSTEKAFYTFLELVSDTLGFTAKTTTKKEDVDKYFSDLVKKLENTSAELEEVAKKATTDVDKDASSKNLIREAVEAAKATLNTLKTNVNLLGTIGDNNVVGYTHNAAGSGTTVADVELKKAYNALKGIVDTAIGTGVKVLIGAGSTTLQANGGADNKDGAKILAPSGSNPGTQDAGKASAILATVSGEEILAAIVASKEGDAQLGAAADANTTAVSFARGGTADHVSGSAEAKAGAVSGGIALRALVKGGKLATGAANDAQGGGKEVQGVGLIAVNKLLVAVEDVVKKTVKKVVEKVKEKIDEGRKPKTVSNE